MRARKWLSPRLRYNDDGEFGQVTGWLLTAPYLRHRFWLFGPRATAVTARLDDFKDKYCVQLTGWPARAVRVFGRCIAEHPQFELWRFNWTVYRLEPPRSRPPMFWRLREWFKHQRNPPVVVIGRSGQATDNPKVHVSVASMNGTQGVYTWDATEQGEACATMYGRGLADTIRRRLVDERGDAHG